MAAYVTNSASAKSKSKKKSPFGEKTTAEMPNTKPGGNAGKGMAGRPNHDQMGKKHKSQGDGKMAKMARGAKPFVSGARRKKPAKA